MHAPKLEGHRISLGEDLVRYNRYKISTEQCIITVHSTYHPSLTWESFIIDKTHVQYG